MVETSSQQDLRPVAKRLVLVDLVTIALMLAVSAWGWVRIPAGRLIAVHWGLNGQPDGYAGKAVGLFWTPCVAVFLSLLILGFLVIPRRETVARSTKAFVAVGTVGMALLLGVHILMVLVAVGMRINIIAVTLTLVGGMFIAIGNYFPKMRRNRWMGVRTPWTRASEFCWDKTHRLASRLFIAAGLLMIVVAWSGLSPIWQAAVLMTCILGVTLVVYIYSYIVWIANPGK